MFIFHLLTALMPYLCLLGTIRLFRMRNGDEPLFSAMAKGSIVWSLILFLETNILSWCGKLDGGIIATFWPLYFFILCPFIFKNPSSWHLPRIRGWGWPPFWIAALTLIVAIAYPPNNYDVLTYHMPRIAHWLQNHSMAPYPTSIDRQVGMAPFNAMIALQSFAPNRLDYFVSLYQWLAFIGCMAGVAQITLLLGGGRLAQICAVVFTATLPAAIIQASNTDSCLLVSFYLCVMAYEYLLWRKEREPSLKKMLLFGAALGLAILSKGSAYPIAFPFVCLVAWRCLREPKKAFIQGLAAAILIVAVNVPHFVRAVEGQGNMVASAERNILTRPTPATFVVNAFYNFFSNQPILLANGARGYWRKISAAIGVSQDDKSVLPWGGLGMAKTYYCPSDSFSPNPFQSVFLIVVALAVIFRKFRPPAVYTGAVLGGFVMFCLILTWHAWISRIHITLFILAAPICGLYIATFKKDWLRNATLALCCFCAIWPVFLCVERPLAPASFVDLYRHNVRHFLSHPRELLLFNNSPPEAGPYVAGADYIAAHNVGRLGLKVGTNGWEYPLWALLDNRMEKLPDIEHVIDDQMADPPPFVFEFVRNDTEGQQALRIVKNSGGGQTVVFPPSAGEKNKNVE